MIIFFRQNEIKIDPESPWYVTYALPMLMMLFGIGLILFAIFH